MSVDRFVSVTRDARPRPKTPLPPPRAWRPTRPGDLDAGQPRGVAYGYQGPDQGYAMLLANRFEGVARLVSGEKWRDVEYGVAGVACRRASLFGRAPVNDDVELAFLVWGFLPEGMASDVVQRLVALRRPLFADVLHDPRAHRRVVEAVAEDVLRSTPGAVKARMAAGEILCS